MARQRNTVPPPRCHIYMQLPDISKTVIAPATAPGKGALSVIRMTGPDSFLIFSKLSSDRYRNPENRQVSLVKIRKNREIIDEAVVVFFKNPHSYTGEDTVEITCHGSPYIVREILAAASAAGAAQASPGEFTLRAFINGKLDLAEAEAVNALIASDSAAAHHAALTQLEGSVSDIVSLMKEETLELLSELEVRLDDSDGDIFPIDTRNFLVRVQNLTRRIDDFAEGFRAGRNISEGIRVVLTGAPNSGKSSLMNMLLGFDRAIVSPEAGTTRDTLEDHVEINGIKIILTDTAGLSAVAGDVIEAEGMKRAMSALRRADTVLLLKDSSVPESEADRIAAECVRKNMPDGAELVHIFTKTDISGLKGTETVCSRNSSDTGTGSACPPESIYISCRTGEGIKKLGNRLTEKISAGISDREMPSVLFLRHYEALVQACSELKELVKIINSGKNTMLEIAAEHLRAALKAFGLITGETAADDVLAKIFSGFCVGK